MHVNMSQAFNSIRGVFNDESPLSHFLKEELRTEWAISKEGFSAPTWNILRRAMMKFDFGGVDYPMDYIEVVILEQLTLLDVKQVKYAGSKRIEDLIQELGTSSLIHAKSDNPDEELGESNELTNQNSKNVSAHSFVLNKILTSEDWRKEFLENYGLKFEYSIFDDDSISREISIFESRMNGETLEAIGNRFGVTRERIRQIVEKAFSRISDNPIFEGNSISQIFDQKKESKKQRGIEDLESIIRSMLNNNPGMKEQELAESINLDVKVVRSHISYQTSKFVFQEQTAHFHDSQFSDDFILGAIKMAAAIRSPLSAPMYENLLERGLVRGPRSQIVAKRFGTWSNACMAAGVMFVQSVRSEYIKNWSEEESLEYLIAFLKSKEFGVGIPSYDKWRAAYQEDAPSSAHLRNTFGTWINAKNSALAYMKMHHIACDLI